MKKRIIIPDFKQRRHGAKINTYIENPDLMKEHKEEARKFVENNHDMKKCIEQLINHYMSPN